MDKMSKAHQHMKLWASVSAYPKAIKIAQFKMDKMSKLKAGHFGEQVGFSHLLPEYLVNTREKGYLIAEAFPWGAQNNISCHIAEARKWPVYIWCTDFGYKGNGQKLT